MELVIDTNILVAAIMKNSLTRNLVLSDSFTLWCPQRSRFEVLKYYDEYLRRSGLNPPEFDMVVDLVFSAVNIIPFRKYSLFEKQASLFCPDPFDWPFFAVALYKQCPIWSNERRLKGQKVIPVYNTADVLSLI